MISLLRQQSIYYLQWYWTAVLLLCLSGSKRGATRFLPPARWTIIGDVTEISLCIYGRTDRTGQTQSFARKVVNTRRKKTRTKYVLRCGKHVWLDWDGAGVAYCLQ